MPSLFQKKTKEIKRSFSGDPDEFRLTLVEHLEELRDRVVRSVVVLCVGWLIGWIYFRPVYAALQAIVGASIRAEVKHGQEYREVFHSTTGMFFLKLKLSFLLGIILVFPYIVLQIWGFVAPALKEREQLPFKRLGPLSLVLFLMGAGFAWLVTPSALRWFASYLEEFQGADLFQEAGAMTLFIIKMLLAFGIAFQLPLIVYGLGMAGLLSAETLMKNWRQAATAIFVVAMIVTPSQDPVTMLMMAIPLCILFIMSVYAVKWVQGKKKADQEPTMHPLE